ncbi:hypothetical protein CU098_009384, partial [Rhizopus stolonifer]
MKIKKPMPLYLRAPPQDLLVRELFLGLRITLSSEVVDEYDTHNIEDFYLNDNIPLSSVDAANNLRDKKIFYHDVVMYLLVMETYLKLKDTLAWTFLKNCEELVNGAEPTPNEDRILRSNTNHS